MTTDYNIKEKNKSEIEEETGPLENEGTLENDSKKMV